MYSLLKNKNCRLRIYEKEKDMHLYNYFLPEIRDYMFWSFNTSKSGLKSFESLDTQMKARLISQHECNIFQYNLKKDVQGKIGEKGGIFFDINEIKIVCFKSGICFILFKTCLQDNKNLSDVLNFNYKFREVKTKTYNLKQYENIRLQSDVFKEVKDISKLIKEITGANTKSEKINLDNEKFIVYSYACLDQHSWNEETENESLKNEFEKFRNILPKDHQIADSVNNDKEIYENKYAKYGFSYSSTVLLTSDINTNNYTTVAQKFESEYLYTYLLILYKKILLKKLSTEFNEEARFSKVEKEFIDFTKSLWIQEITNDEFGRTLEKRWYDCLDVEEIFVKLKSKYDVIYKKYNLSETKDKGNKLFILVIALIVISIINLLMQLR